MDLRDLVQEDISSVASIFAFKSFGGLIGILGPGLLLDRQAGYNTDGDSPLSNISRYIKHTQTLQYNTRCRHEVFNAALARFRPSAEFLFLAATYSVKSLATLALPFCPSLAWMQAVEFLYGLCHGAFHSVGAVT